MPTYQGSWVWRDFKGLTGWTRVYISQGTAAAARTNLLNLGGLAHNISNAALERVTSAGASSPVPAAYGVNAEYRSIQDKVKFIFTTAAGARFDLIIPAPKAGIFYSDRETVNISTGGPAALIVNVISNHLCTRDGFFLVACLGAYRIRRSHHRQRGLLLKEPHLLAGMGSGS
jgi:hypothetical protein